MNEILAGKLDQNEEARDRCQLIHGDIVGPECAPNEILRCLPLRRQKQGFDAVISAFALHHLESPEKRCAYQRVFSLLRPGGIFLNADLFSFQDSGLSKAALAFDLEWIRSEFGKAGSDGGGGVIDRRSAARMAKKWRQHYLVHNRTEPIEDAAIGGGQGQASMLRDVGFETVAVPFRYWQVGILLAKKGV